MTNWRAYGRADWWVDAFGDRQNRKSCCVWRDERAESERSEKKNLGFKSGTVRPGKWFVRHVELKRPGMVADERADGGVTDRDMNACSGEFFLFITLQQDEVSGEETARCCNRKWNGQMM
ncbi:hypothetical protein KFK09_024266 [Dendrobium nobile]|uniref:Uncharacterized protein n=1 Tax=Dendrobium nobile TaxID=94219 RepID=A0A8T3AIY7_DENNO|nr:hypothetical protein KFK09_024266 [Dendrobium nobile]